MKAVIHKMITFMTSFRFHHHQTNPKAKKIDYENSDCRRPKKPF